MTLEQLQDYALELETNATKHSEEMAKKDNEISELNDLNKSLQKRNFELFQKVEQQPTPSTEVKDDEPVISCEDLARNLYKEIK